MTPKLQRSQKALLALAILVTMLNINVASWPGSTAMADEAEVEAPEVDIGDVIDICLVSPIEIGAGVFELTCETTPEGVDPDSYAYLLEPEEGEDDGTRTLLGKDWQHTWDNRWAGLGLKWYGTAGHCSPDVAYFAEKMPVISHYHDDGPPYPPGGYYHTHEWDNIVSSSAGGYNGWGEFWHYQFEEYGGESRNAPGEIHTWRDHDFNDKTSSAKWFH